jgi:hypothetical protein
MDSWKEEQSLFSEKMRRGRLGKTLVGLMNKLYQPEAKIDGIYKDKDLTFITNDVGEPMTLFIGKRKENGNIAGYMYTRQVRRLKQGLIVESHWENQGKIS